MSTPAGLSRLLAIIAALATIFRSKQDLVLENLALRQQLITLKAQQPRPRLSRFERICWVWLRRLWGKWQAVICIVQPETVVAWHRAGFRLYWSFVSRNDKQNESESAKRRREILRKVRQLAMDNPTWGAPRIHGELLKLGFSVKERTISRYLRRIRPPGGHKSKWYAFIQNHKQAIAAMDFFVVPTILFRPLYGFFIIAHEDRRILHFGVTFHPTAAWVATQLNVAFTSAHSIKYLLFDRDSIFSPLVTQTLKALGIEPMRTAFKSPWQNGIAERFVGSLRREMLDHVIVLSESHLYALIQNYVDYYHHDRTHYNLKKETPFGRSVEAKPSDGAEFVALPRVSGLHHRYVWRRAA